MEEQTGLIQCCERETLLMGVFEKDVLRKDLYRPPGVSRRINVFVIFKSKLF